MANITETGKHLFAGILTEVGERVVSILTEIGERSFVTVGDQILPSGIGGAEAFGSHTIANVNKEVFPSGIASGEDLGVDGRIILYLLPSSIGSAEAFGTPAFAPSPLGIVSGEAFGEHHVSTTGQQSINPGSIGSGEAVSSEIQFGMFLNYFEYVTEVVSENGQLVLKKRTIERTGILVATRPRPAGWALAWGDKIIPLS